MILIHIYINIYSSHEKEHSVLREDESRYVCTMHKKERFVPLEKAENNKDCVIETNCIAIGMTYPWCIGSGFHFYFALEATVCIGLGHFQRYNIRFTNKKCFHNRSKKWVRCLVFRVSQVVTCILLSRFCTQNMGLQFTVPWWNDSRNNSNARAWLCSWSI